VERVRKAILSLALLAACGADTGGDVDTDDFVFPEGGDGKADGSLERQPLDSAETGLIDLRGVGDSAWAGNKTATPLAAGLGAALDRFDASGISYRGDVSYLNFESVVGTRCTTFTGDQFGFLSHPDNITQVIDRGFQLIGLSNNHTRDCGDSTSPAMTSATMKATVRAGDAAWSGVAPVGESSTTPSIYVVHAKGKEIRVAFSSLYLGRASCPQANCNDDRIATMTKLRDADADLRVLAIHVLEFNNDWQGVAEVGTAFVHDYNGDVVYGSGPHVWKPPILVEKRDGSGHKGIVFTSLGNFIHPSLRGQAHNMIGRALFDPDTMTLKQVQMVTVATAGMSASFGATDASDVGSYGTQTIPWKDYTDTANGETLHAAYVNVPQ
jgi:poly-gamma-glutamate synthesis protein (capsule biosynthesis protein)